ncbi:aldehyde dehydrogenase (NAD+) [Saccharopolyspora kobensis]|uniref:Aldehyde dehydrogenase (NAD+) n=1 Tax=Saccharopolyspora kobensis TaxID=146035 RepID=A0A1H5UN91_9PSEU|nr:succinic semialdehyde dehydrogenase [Saccharopolyspora kobensis]SEF76532.1 aldehyde dehydrogenase (NAD+) [Saccharopolyspora kobensis]SFC71504.1 aldehyde dehydrogenase (NAD+)/succinate-semialdehyde dehydrogenase / glutarate-semialdehyde dehydrogenase [Saccharopolyspora kobensis]
MSSSTAQATATPLDAATVRRLTSGIAATGEPRTTTAPFTGAALATIPQSTDSDVRSAFARAREAQREWASTPVRERVRPFLRLVDMMLSRQSEVLDLIQHETGKARLHAFEEVLDGAMSTLYYARKAPQLLRGRRRAGALPVFTRTIETPLPKGVVTTITPWNYPLALTMDVVPALLAGNAVVHKPDSQTALSSLWPRALLVEAGLPQELWQVVLGEPGDIGNALIDEADYVGFTGSTAAGKAIAERAAKQLTGCSLELGGKNPMLVLDDADLAATAKTAVRACFANAGQLCVSIERIYVDAAVHDEFVELFARQVRDLRLNSDLAFTADVGSLTSERQLARVTEHVEAAVEAGATVAAGGKARPDLGPYFFEPTVLTGVVEGTPVCREETFGPVVSVYPFRSEDEAIELANDTPYGLNASVFSRDERRARRVAARIKAGTVNLNEGYAAAYASQGASMGGMKESGLGRRHGPAGLLKYTEAQSVASQRVLGFDPAFGLSGQQHAKLFTAALRVIKALRIR